MKKSLPKPGRLVAAVVAAGAISLIILSLGTCLGRFGRTTIPMVILGGTWTRTIVCEVRTIMTRTAWQDEVPEGAKVTRTWQEERRTERVRTGSEQVPSETDENSNTERPVFEERPVLDTRAEFEEETWSTSREIVLSGRLGETPTWPSLTLEPGEQESARRESAVIYLQGELDRRSPGPKTAEYRKLSPDEMKVYRSGDRVTAVVRKRNGKVLRIYSSSS